MHYDIPFGTNEQFLARGGNAGPAWEWALGPDTESGPMAKGSLDWVSGRSYAWTLSYTGTGAATLEVRDQGNLVLSLSYPSGMEAGNGLQFTVSTNASIGPQTTLAATVSRLNGQSVTGSLSQTGTNQEAEQNLFFYYPPMASGFTASGAVTLSYASLPSGGRVRFRARAGALPCANLAPTVSLTAPGAGTIHHGKQGTRKQRKQAETGDRPRFSGQPVCRSKKPWSVPYLPSIAARQAAYRELFRYQLDPGLVDEIRRATNGNYALGNERFTAQVSEALGRRATPGKSGRPSKTVESEPAIQGYE